MLISAKDAKEEMLFVVNLLLERVLCALCVIFWSELFLNYVARVGYVAVS